MGQLRPLRPPPRVESLMPVDVIAPGKQRYGLLLTDEGTIIDDLMLVNRGDDIFVIVNGACKAGDIAHIREHRSRCRDPHARTLLALQARAVRRWCGWCPAWTIAFMTGSRFQWRAVSCSRRAAATPARTASNFVHESQVALARLLSQPEVKPSGWARNCCG
jgi:aminomethyltransferase